MKKVFLLVLFLSFEVCFAQNIYEFLKLNTSPRAEALAGSFITNNDDVNVIFYNPAGINSIEGKPITFSYLKYISDIKLFTIAYSQEIENIGRFAAGIKYVNFGKFIRADKNGTKLGEFGVNDLAFTLGYGRTISPNLSLGANFNFIHSQISDYNSTGIAFDLGTQYSFPEEEIIIAASLRNYGTQLSTYMGVKEDLPLNLSIGVSKKLKRLPLRISLAFNKLNVKEDKVGDRLTKFAVGAELNLSKTITLRLGYDNEKRKDLKISTSTGLAGFNMGVGIVIKDYLIDYAFSSYGEIEAVHRIGISTSF